LHAAAMRAVTTITVATCYISFRVEFLRMRRSRFNCELSPFLWDSSTQPYRMIACSKLDPATEPRCQASTENRMNSFM